MNTTKINKTALLSELQTNRAKHEAEFREAREEWERQAILRFREVLDEMERDDFDRTINPTGGLPKPTNFLASYDMAIQRLEWEESDTVELDEREFANYVRDDWDWKGHFAQTNAYYVS